MGVLPNYVPLVSSGLNFGSSGKCIGTCVDRAGSLVEVLLFFVTE